MHGGTNGKIECIEEFQKLRKTEWAVQEKIDGAYCEVHIDANGRVYSIRGKNGKELGDRRSRSLMGCFGGYPGSVLCGEIEAHTEAGIKAFEAKGFANLHVFDAKKIGCRDLSKLPYWMRRDELYKAWSDLCEASGADAPYNTDRLGFAHDRLGRFCKKIPFAWRRFPIVAQYAIDRMAWYYHRVLRRGGEGVVLVDQNARMGLRRSKVKLKPIDTLDCEVVEVGERTITCVYYVEEWANAAWKSGLDVINAESKEFYVGKNGKDLSVGDIVEVCHNGTYENGTLRFPKIKRVRGDL